jgi:hypothetical protein
MDDVMLVREEPRGPSILIEVPITTNKQKVPLPDVQELRSTVGQTIIIKSIRLLSAKVLANGIISQLVNAPLGQLINMTLTLYSQGWLKGQNIPVLVLNDVNDSDAATASTIPFRNVATKLADWRNVDWPQSFIQFANGFVPTPSYVVMFEVEYLKLNAQNEVIDTAS